MSQPKVKTRSIDLDDLMIKVTKDGEEIGALSVAALRDQAGKARSAGINVSAAQVEFITEGVDASQIGDIKSILADLSSVQQAAQAQLQSDETLKFSFKGAAARDMECHLKTMSISDEPAFEAEPSEAPAPLSEDALSAASALREEFIEKQIDKFWLEVDEAKNKALEQVKPTLPLSLPKGFLGKVKESELERIRAELRDAANDMRPDFARHANLYRSEIEKVADKGFVSSVKAIEDFQNAVNSLPLDGVTSEADLVAQSQKHLDALSSQKDFAIEAIGGFSKMHRDRIESENSAFREQAAKIAYSDDRNVSYTPDELAVDQSVAAKMKPKSEAEQKADQQMAGVHAFHGMIMNGDPEIEDKAPEAESLITRAKRVGLPRRPHLWPDVMAWPMQPQFDEICKPGVTEKQRQEYFDSMEELSMQMLARSRQINDWIMNMNDPFDQKPTRTQKLLGTRRLQSRAIKHAQATANEAHQGIKWATLLDDMQTQGADNLVREWGQAHAVTNDGGQVLATKDTIEFSKDPRVKITAQAIEVAILEAKARGWGSLKMQGDAHFCQMAIEAANRHGMRADITEFYGVLGMSTKVHTVMPPVPTMDEDTKRGIAEKVAEKRDGKVAETAKPEDVTNEPIKPYETTSGDLPEPKPETGKPAQKKPDEAAQPPAPRQDDSRPDEVPMEATEIPDREESGSAFGPGAYDHGPVPN